jgi:hypothetical protein
MKKKKRLTATKLYRAYEAGGQTEVEKLCEHLPRAFCEPCECDVPEWNGICAVCFSTIEEKQ